MKKDYVTGTNHAISGSTYNIDTESRTSSENIKVSYLNNNNITTTSATPPS